MATRCHACRRPLPEGARTCPGCGELVRRGLGTGAKLGLLAVLGIGAGGAWVATQGWPTSEEPAPSREADGAAPRGDDPPPVAQVSGDPLPPLGAASRRIDGGELEIAGARLELSPDAIEGEGGIGLIRTQRAQTGALAERLASDVYFLSANARGRLVDDAHHRHGTRHGGLLGGGDPQAYAVVASGALVPVSGSVSDDASRVWIDAPEVNVEGAAAILHRRTPAIGEPDVPPPNPIGYAVAARGIAAGDLVLLENARGACLAGAVLTTGIRRDCVSLATGAWFDPQEIEGRRIDLHGNPNALTIDKGASGLSQGNIAHTAVVRLSRWEGEAPPVSVHRQPPLARRGGQEAEE